MSILEKYWLLFSFCMFMDLVHQLQFKKKKSNVLHLTEIIFHMKIERFQLELFVLCSELKGKSPKLIGNWLSLVVHFAEFKLLREPIRFSFSFRINLAI